MIGNYDWWEFIPNANRMLNDIASLLTEQGKSAVLLLPSDVPWHNKMRTKLNMLLDKPDKHIDVCEPPEDILPGEFLLTHYFSPSARNKYRSTTGYEKFIATYDEITPLNDCFMIVVVRSATQLAEWDKFVAGYSKENSRRSDIIGCRFILEYMTNESEKKLRVSLDKVSWDSYIFEYDKYMYALLSVSRIKASKERLEYLSVIVSMLSGDDIELAAELAEHSTDCLSAPAKVLAEINSGSVRSNGKPFVINIDNERMDSLLWEAQVKVLFPKIERYKDELIEKCSVFFGEDFSHTTAYGREKTDYHDLELGDILHLNKYGKVKLSDVQETTARFYKSCRDCLAHSTPVPFEDVMKLLK